MKIWATIRSDHHIIAETTQEFPQSIHEIEDWGEIISALCRPLDLSRPVILRKHENDLRRFSRVVFKPGDFLEPVDFDRYEVEIFPEEKKTDR